MVERPAGGVKKGAIKCIFVLFPLASGGLVCCQSPQETKGGEGPPAWLRAPWHPSAQGKLKQVLQKVGSQRAQLRCVMRVFPVVNLVRLTQRVAHTNSTTTPRTNPWSRLSSLFTDNFTAMNSVGNVECAMQCYVSNVTYFQRYKRSSRRIYREVHPFLRDNVTWKRKVNSMERLCLLLC